LRNLGQLAYRLFNWYRGWTFRSEAGAETYRIAYPLFRWGMAIGYAMAFGSLAVQITGLIGTEGILPISTSLQFGFSGNIASAMWAKPSLFWIFSQDWMVLLGAWGGVLGALALGMGLFPSILAVVLWGLYLSFVSVGDVFFQFQWDILLLEGGAILAVMMIAGKSIWLGRIAVSLLLFRVIWMSAVVKLTSGDWMWWSGEAVRAHFFSQPLPHLGAWVAGQLPMSVAFGCTALVLILELVLPVFLLMTRRLRHIAVTGIWILMAMIMVTGNFGFFNFIVLALTLAVLDDRAYLWVSAGFGRIAKGGASHFWGSTFKKRVAMGGFVVLIGAGIGMELDRYHYLPTRVANQTVELLSRWHLVGRYGLFAVMTTTRTELSIEGSLDGASWFYYPFKYKLNTPEDLSIWTVWHMPRLDWMMWFASLSSFERSPWLHFLVKGLFEDRPEVVSLFESSPFTATPPQFIRITSKDYTFSSVSTRINSGRFWETPVVDPDHIRLYSPILVSP